jgi:hypothetical protein
MLETCRTSLKIPLFYAYIIAFEARAQAGLQDCDVNFENSLCKFGSNYIRSNRSRILERYTQNVGNISKIMGRDATVIFLIEPDFW